MNGQQIVFQKGIILMCGFENFINNIGSATRKGGVVLGSWFLVLGHWSLVIGH